MSEQSRIIRPVAEPLVIDDVYSDDQYHRIIDVISRNGPWKMVLAQHFKTAEQVVATMSGGQLGGELTLDHFLTPNFQGFFGKNGVCYFEELEDVFYSSKNLKLVRQYWSAKYASPDSMNFIIQGASRNIDPAHLDGVSFRGIDGTNTPLWLRNIMGKSGLFHRWLAKKGQVISWYYKGTIGGGFTYWPDGPLARPKRLAMPSWGRGVVTQNEMMFHRGEACGPLHKRMPPGLALESQWSADGDSPGDWKIYTGENVIERVSAAETRLMLHWTASIYTDLDEMTLAFDHKDDLTHEIVFDHFIKDIRSRGVSCSLPSHPLADGDFIRQLTQMYDGGRPTIYPDEAPGPHQAEK